MYKSIQCCLDGEFFCHFTVGRPKSRNHTFLGGQGRKYGSVLAKELMGQYTQNKVVGGIRCVTNGNRSNEG